MTAVTPPPGLTPSPFVMAAGSRFLLVVIALGAALVAACPTDLAPTMPEESSGNPCLLPKVAGFGRGYFQRFFYDSASNTCKSFVFHGGASNANNFFTRRDCEVTCLSKKE